VSRPDTPDVPLDLLHLCFGGLGGHAGVVLPLDTELHRRGLTTAVVRYAPGDQLADGTGWSAVPGALVVEKHGRLDVRGHAEVARLVRRRSPRAVLCHTASLAGPAFLGQLLDRRRPCIGLVEHQAVDLRSRGDQVTSLLALAVVRGVAVLSDDYARRYPLSWVPSRKVRELAVLPSGIDLEVFSPLPEAIGAEGRGRVQVIGMTCRLVPTKDVETLLRSIPPLRAALDGAVELRLRIAGDGRDRPTIEGLIHELGLGDVVELVGTLDEGGVVAFLRGLDVYVQSTLGESGATAVLQAYAVGLAVVASDVEGVGTLVRDGIDGLLVPGRDPAALARCLSELLADDERRNALGRAARRRAEADFGAERMAERYLGFLEQMDPDGPWRAARAPGDGLERWRWR
jgi:glycosyltransferase involved in cell wall biosynthesis